MTPEQMADNILTEHTVKTLAPVADPLALKRLIAAALRTAIEQERERCAQVIEQFDTSVLPYRPYNDGVFRSALAVIIRHAR